MNNSDPMVTWPLGNGAGLSPRFPGHDGAVLDDRFPGDSGKGLVSFSFIGASLRRGARIWCAIGLLGLLIGGFAYLKFPPAYKATISVLLVNNPAVDPGVAAQSDVALAESTQVATDVVHQLGLKQGPGSFLGSYTVLDDTNAVLTITASGPNSGQAVQRASAIASQFLKVRDQYALIQQQQTQAQLEQQVSLAQQRLNSASPANQRAASNALQQVQQYAAQTMATTRTNTQALIRGSVVIDAAAPVKRSILASGILYTLLGLIGGGVVGMAIVIIGAITSDRLRRRDDIAFALGAPVRLSVGSLREGPRFPRQAVKRRRDMERVVEYLRTAVPGSSSGPAGLAVVAVDDARAVARVIVALAASSGAEGKKVVLADLSAGAHAARLLGVDGLGITAVSTDGGQIVVVVPAANDIAPVGPLGSCTAQEGYAQADESLTAACFGADLVLTLATLDPAFGGEHLATWATDAVVVVTAGQSSAVRIHAVGEMIRLGGTRLGSVVVLDTEKGDESIGAVTAAYEPHVA